MKGEQSTKHKEKTMTDLGMIMLHINGLNATIKTYSFSGCIKPNIGLEDSIFLTWKLSPN